MKDYTLVVSEPYSSSCCCSLMLTMYRIGCLEAALQAILDSNDDEFIYNHMPNLIKQIEEQIDIKNKTLKMIISCRQNVDESKILDYNLIYIYEDKIGIYVNISED